MPVISNEAIQLVYWTDHLHWTFMSCYNCRKKSGKIKTAYKREYVNAGLDVDLDFAGPTIHGAAVAGYDGWLAGYQMTIDSAKSKMTHSNFAVGYKTGDFQLHTNVYVLARRSAGGIVKWSRSEVIHAFWAETTGQSLAAPFTRRSMTTWRLLWIWPGQRAATAPALELLPNTSLIPVHPYQ